MPNSDKMTELKTLKDFDDMGEIILNIRNLKAEAVKWVKANNEDGDPTLIQSRADINTWIKHFFNLTEEDLK